MIRCSASPVSHEVSSPISVFRYDAESGCRCVEVKLMVRPLTSIATLMAERPPLSSRGSPASIGKRDRIMHPMPVALPDSVSNLEYQVFPVFFSINARRVAGSSVFLLQLVFFSTSFNDTMSGLNFATQV